MNTVTTKFRTFATGKNGKLKKVSKKIKIITGIADENRELQDNHQDNINFPCMDAPPTPPPLLAIPYPNYRFFPFHWVWMNNIEGYRFQLNTVLATQQLHIIQDFDYGIFKMLLLLIFLLNLEMENGEARLYYHKTMVAVLVVVTKYANNQKKYWAICSACDSASDLVR